MLRILGSRAASRLATAALRAPSTLAVQPRRLLCQSAAKAPPVPEPSTLQRIQQQIVSEVSGASENPAKLYGFFGACCNWFLGLSAVYDATQKGPEVISLKMTCVMICYSTLFSRWAGWAVSPRNYVLAGSHIFNVVAQCNQLRRVLEHKLEHGGAAAKAEIQELATKAAIGGATVAAFVTFNSQIKAVVAPLGPAYLSSAGGPFVPRLSRFSPQFTIHPWPPVTKIAISGTSLLELDRPTDKISLSQYSALTLTGAIFSRYGLVVSPIEYPSPPPGPQPPPSPTCPPPRPHPGTASSSRRSTTRSRP